MEEQAEELQATGLISPHYNVQIVFKQLQRGN